MRNKSKLPVVAAVTSLCLFPLVSIAETLDAIELINFKCPHCRHMNAYAPAIRKELEMRGGILRMAPIEPALRDTPSISVRFWYALDDIAGDKVAETAATYLYLGYQKGAQLNSVASVYAWLQNYMGKLPNLSKLRTLAYGPEVKHQWALALHYTHYLKTTKVPAFIFVNADNFTVTKTIQRDVNGKDANELYSAIKKYLATAYTPTPKLKLPWERQP